MFEITRSLEWDMGHRIPNHCGKCRFPHGHRYRLECTLKGDINDIKGDSSEGMVVDFSELKEVLSSKIYKKLDHRFMLFEGDPMIEHTKPDEKGREYLNYFIVSFIPTAENIAKWCFEQIESSLSESLTLVKCRIYETPNNWVDYHA
ncbi:MAG: hypothetical protein CMP11_07825 [Zetaproteobacteria bacterium]|nr:hypothetical protein [Pseudobdellovibrionaceae bacterium]|tara:strand:+ start:1141 stop:1581 length:441 start_codon:yes stop_codon:yes gene_type:complete